MRSTRMKVSMSNRSFGPRDMPQLEYMITLEEIKPNTRKVQDIADLERPTITTELKSIDIMV